MLLIPTCHPPELKESCLDRSKTIFFFYSLAEKGCCKNVAIVLRLDFFLISVGFNKVRMLLDINLISDQRAHRLSP